MERIVWEKGEVDDNEFEVSITPISKLKKIWTVAGVFLYNKKGNWNDIQNRKKWNYNY